MLIRFAVRNIFSFKEHTEFNMLPGRQTRLPHHLYKTNHIELLKLNAMYGANGAGKSNLITALLSLHDFVTTGEMPISWITESFKFDKQGADKDMYFGIEFLKNSVPYYYGVTVNKGIVTEEELLISGLNKKQDKRLLLRTDSPSEKTSLHLEFSEDVSQNLEANAIVSFLQNDLLERNKSALYYMEHRQNKVFDACKSALEWFREELIIITPHIKPAALALRLEKDNEFREYAVEVMKSFNTGVENIIVKTIPVEEYFGVNNKSEAEKVTADLRANENNLSARYGGYETIIFMLQDDRAVAKKIYLTHKENKDMEFDLSEESDGTRRLLDYLPVFFGALNTPKVYVVDEIERSIHPLLIKELIKKFADDAATKGQLIFTTHESNLLDQDIFRQDEIWFAEKNIEGATELSVLSEFREHHTTSIKNGYLNGRYGGIPFLGNLKDLNWNKYAEA